MLYCSKIGQNQNGVIKNIDSRCNTHIYGLAYSFIKTLNIVEIPNEKFLAIPKFGFFASSSAIVGWYGVMRRYVGIAPRWFL
jgi:hypothetical protein